MRDPGEKKSPMIQAERKVTIRDYLIFVLKLALDGMKDGLLITLSTVAVVVDVLSVVGRRPRLFYSVLRMSERFDLWLNLNGAVEKMDAGLDEDGLFGASDAGADTLLGKIEQMVRGGDEPRGGWRKPLSTRPEGSGEEAGGSTAPTASRSGPRPAPNILEEEVLSGPPSSPAQSGEGAGTADDPGAPTPNGAPVDPRSEGG